MNDLFLVERLTSVFGCKSNPYIINKVVFLFKLLDICPKLHTFAPKQTNYGILQTKIQASYNAHAPVFVDRNNGRSKTDGKEHHYP